MLAAIDPGLVALLAAITTPVSVALVAYLNARTAAANEAKRQAADEESKIRQEAMAAKATETHDVVVAVDAAVNGKAPGEKSLSQQVGDLYDAMPADGTTKHPGTPPVGVATIATQVADIAEQMPVVKDQVDDLHDALPRDADNGHAVDLAPAATPNGNGESLKVMVAKMAEQQATMVELITKLVKS